MAFIPASNSVVAFQSDPTKLQASVTGRVDIGNFSAIPGSVVAFLGNSTNASVIVVGGTAGNSSVMLTQGTNTVGSIATLQGTNPWIVQLTSGSVITSGGNSSVQVNNIITGQSSVYLIPGVGVLGSVAALQGTNPWVIGNSSVTVMGIVPASVSGVGIFNVNHIGNGSIQTVSLGSIATAPFPASVSGVGIFNVNHTGNGSIITVFSNPSIVGTYAEDAPSADGDKGIFALAIRNDAVASFVSADKDYTAHAVDSAGRMLIKPFAANEAYITGVSSTVNTGPSSLISGAGAGLRNYITDVWLTNTGSVATLVTFRDGDASVIGKTIAPAGGGSNLIGLATPMRTGGFNQPIEFTAGTATSTLHATALGYKAP